jgi:plasmid stabilization system protein ParE
LTRPRLADFAYRAISNWPTTRIAAKWYNRLLSAIKGLSHSPQRCGLARESEITGREIRQLLFGRRSGKRRVLFVIKQDEVHILGIRHSAQSDAPPEELLD